MKKSAINLRLGPDGRGTVTVDAEIVGPFGIARFPSTEHGSTNYSITHLGTGYAAARARTKKGALAAARKLRDIRGIDWSNLDVKGARNLPDRQLRLIHRIRREALEW